MSCLTDPFRRFSPSGICYYALFSFTHSQAGRCAFCWRQALAPAQLVTAVSQLLNIGARQQRRREAGLAERGVAIPGPGDYVRVWRSRELERSGKLGCTDTLSTELTGSTTPAAVILFVACRLRRRWSELGGWYAAQMADTRLHPLDCACWN